jgi:FkbM family methyltransferase
MFTPIKVMCPSHFFQNFLRLLLSPRLALQYMRWVICQTILKKPPIATFSGGIHFSGFINFSEFWLWYRGLDSTDLAVIDAVAEDSEQPTVAIDVGANLGLFSLAMAKRGFEKVYAFEPIPETFVRLRDNIDLNRDLEDHITINQIGIGEKESTLEFLLNEKSPGQNKIAANQNIDSCKNNTLSCEVVTLESAFENFQIDRANLVKIDVEGYEVAVLKGAKSLMLSDRIDFIYAEVIPKALEEAGSDVDELSMLLDEAGYDPVLLNEADPIFQVVSFHEAVADAGTRRNVLFRRRSLSFS